MSENDVVLEVEGLVKQFPGVLANDNVSMQMRKGEILALLGENGAGKTTLMNMIYGLYHPDAGTIRLKGQEVHFSSPREAIHSGIGMVHQHFQLVNVMTVAENVVLGEEAGIAYRGEDRPLLRWVLQWLPSLVVFGLIFVLSLLLTDWTKLSTLSEWKYLLGGLVIGGIAAVNVATPPLARVLWGVAWRVGLLLVALWIGAQIELMTRVGLTDIALRREVETVRVFRDEDVDGNVVKSSRVTRERIPFRWRMEADQADDAGTGTEGLLESAKKQMEPYRDEGIPGWLLDAIDDAPQEARGFSLALLLFLFGWYSLSSWRGVETSPRRLQRYDLVALGGLVLAYVLFAMFRLPDTRDGIHLTHVQVITQILLFALAVSGLEYVLWRVWLRRGQVDDTYREAVSPLDSVLDTTLDYLQNITQIGNMDLAARRVRDLSQQYGLEVDPDAVIEKLPVGAQQRVEIIKALYRQADILILDEPTAVLTPQEGRELFKIMRGLASQGVSIIFITHKLKEVFEVATKIVVMRDGRVVGSASPDEATETSLAAMMVGREVILQVEKDEAHPTGPVLRVRDLSAYNDRGALALNGVSFDVRAGEVLGIAGVQGNGQTELVEVLTGLRDATGGSVKLLGTELQPDVQPDAGQRGRISAFIVDTVIAVVFFFVVNALFNYFAESTVEDWSTLVHIGAGLGILIYVTGLYFVAGWEIAGSTIGMSLFGLQVVTPEDKKPSLIRINREYVLGISVGLIGAMIVLGIVSSDGVTAGWWLIRFVALLGLLVWLLGIVVLHVQVMLFPHLDWLREWFALRVIHREHITPRLIKDIGTSHVPEDRRRHGLVSPYSVADNLVLNDFYERPYAKEPNTAQLPGALLRYTLIVGLIVGVCTALAVWVWDSWLWTAILDAYDVPEALRQYEMGKGLTDDQYAVFQWPFLISVFLLLGLELIVGFLAHLAASRILGLQPVQKGVHEFDHQIAKSLWQMRGHEGEPPEPEGGLLRDEEAIRAHARDLIQQFDIRTPSSETPGGSLSGGNQQKMIVARELSRKPRLLIAAQPTRGIDVGSIEFIHQQLVDQRDAGAAVLLVSAELDEIMALSDRIAVVYKGEIIDTVPGQAATREDLGLLMAGIHEGPSTPAYDDDLEDAEFASPVTPAKADVLAERARSLVQTEEGQPRKAAMAVAVGAVISAIVGAVAVVVERLRSRQKE